MSRRGWIVALALLLATTLASCGGSETETLAQAAQRVIRALDLSPSTEANVEKWLSSSETRFGLSFTDLADRAAKLAPTVRDQPIAARAADFIARNRIPEAEGSAVQHVFVSSLCDAASDVLLGRPVDSESIVDSAIKSYAGSLSDQLELYMLRSDLEQEVVSYALAKTAADQAGVRSEMAYTLDCFFVGKLGG